MIRHLFRKITHLIQGMTSKTPLPKREFSLDRDTGIQKRDYTTYAEYLDHQVRKLNTQGNDIKHYDQEYEDIVRNRYITLGDWKGKSVICLAARLGGEVRAFKSLGALAIGIDIEPGPKNCHVLHGDFHHLEFPDESFDVAFTNAVDHVYDLRRFLQEAARVLKRGGQFICEVCQNKPSKYEVLDLAELNPLLVAFQEYFSVERQQNISMQAGFVKWTGTLVVLQKK